MPTAKARAFTILSEFEQAQTELVGNAVVLTDGKAGTVERVWLDNSHGLRISIRGHDGKWPISTIKFAQTAINSDPNCETANKLFACTLTVTVHAALLRLVEKRSSKSLSDNFEAAPAVRVSRNLK